MPLLPGWNRTEQVPWQSGCSATWDVTVAHSMATSYVSQNVLQTGTAAAATSVRKTTKYSTLSASHIFFRRRYRLLVLYRTRPTTSSQKSAEEPRSAQPIRKKLRSCNNAFLWQFSVSTQSALPTRSQFPSPHRNHSGPTVLYLLISRPWE